MCASCICIVLFFVCFFFFKQKTAYEMRISDWSSDVCSSDLYRPMLDRVLNWPKAALSGALLLVALSGVAATSLGSEFIPDLDERSEERRVGKEGVSTCRSRWSPYN